MKKIPDVRSLDSKVRPVIAGPLATYIHDMHKTGLWGSTPSEVVRSLVRDSIIRTLEGKLIPTRRFDDKGRAIL